MFLAAIPYITSVAFNPWVLSAGIISSTDLACRGLSNFSPDVVDSSLCQFSRNIIQGTANTFFTTIKVANGAGKAFDATSKAYDAAADTLEKGAQATSNFIGVLNTASSKVFDLASHPYAPHIAAGVTATVVGIYATVKITRFFFEYRQNNAKLEILHEEVHKNKAQAKVFEAETRKVEAEVRKAEAEIEIPKSQVAKISLETKVTEAELEKKKFEIGTAETSLQKEKLEVEIKKLELKEKKLQLLSAFKTRTQKIASTQTGVVDAA